MKKQLLITITLICVAVGYSQPNFYTANSLLSTNRTVNLDGKFLNFNSTTPGGNLYINTVGNVGIGNTAPMEKLEVSGVVKSKNLFASNLATSATSFQDVGAYYKNSTVFSAGYEMSDAAQPGAFRRMINFYDLHQWSTQIGVNNDRFTFNIVDRNNKERLYFAGSRSGGTNNGSAYFVINDKNAAEIFKVSDDGNNATYLQMAKTNSRLIIGGYGNYAPGLTHKLVVQSGSALIEGNILTNGNIGIGSSTFIDGIDSYRLSVSGGIRAHRVKVYTSVWPDFVFNNNYLLPTLEEVEKHIEDNGHLKDIPSAKEVETNGIELGEMNKLLLQKVEELTLYIIDLNKSVKKMEDKLNKQEDEN